MEPVGPVEKVVETRVEQIYHIHQAEMYDGDKFCFLAQNIYLTSEECKFYASPIGILNFAFHRIMYKEEYPADGLKVTKKGVKGGIGGMMVGDFRWRICGVGGCLVTLVLPRLANISWESVVREEGGRLPPSLVTITFSKEEPVSRETFEEWWAGVQLAEGFVSVP